MVKAYTANECMLVLSVRTQGGRVMAAHWGQVRWREDQVWVRKRGVLVQRGGEAHERISRWSGIGKRERGDAALVG